MIPLSICPPRVPVLLGHEHKSQPITFLGVMQQIPNVLSGNYDHCNFSQSYFAAENIVNDGVYVIAAIVSYLLACVIVSLITKLKKKNSKKE